MVDIILHRKRKTEQHEPRKNRGNLRCHGKVTSTDVNESVIELFLTRGCLTGF